MKKICFLLLFLLCACGPSPQDMDDGLYKLHGINEQTCVDLFGKPTKKSYVKNTVVLTWIRKDPAKLKTSGDYINSGIDGETGRPIVAPEKDLRNYCIMKITLEKDQVIHHAFAGDKAGCEPWGRVLEQKFGHDTFAFPD